MSIDFFPTILTLAGLDAPTDRIVDGRNIWGLLSDESAKSPHDALFFFHDYEIEGISGTDTPMWLIPSIIMSSPLLKNLCILFKIQL